MSKCFDHEATFLDTHRHFRLAIKISRICSIICGGLELKKEQLGKQTCLDSQPTLLNCSIPEWKQQHIPDPLWKNKVCLRSPPTMSNCNITGKLLPQTKLVMTMIYCPSSWPLRRNEEKIKIHQRRKSARARHDKIGIRLMGTNVIQK